MSTASRYARDEGIIVKRIEFGEMDFILTLFTRRRGKFQAIAKGARKLGNRFGGALDLFNFCDFFFYTASGMTNLVQAKIRYSFRNLLQGKEKWISGEYLLYLLDKVFEFEKSEEAVLEELLGLWREMLKMQEVDTRPYLLTLRFRLMLLRFSGIVPQIATCMRCGKKFGQEESFLVLSEGGRVCHACNGGANDTLFLSPLSGRVLEYLFSSSLDETLKLRLTVEQFQDVDELLSLYLSHHLERKIFSLGHFLTWVKQNY
ncbi:MAG: DNA repair protein RecO [Atribacterota bacterium]|nr:DNA repair protein RecO [Atribacterota bacterium]